MDLPQKLVFVVQSNQLQGLIWQALLKSQKLSVILESGESDLVDCIQQLAAAGLTLPDVILLDAEASGVNPYEFCRWCRSNYPDINLFLTRSRQAKLTDTEKRWAIHQGALDFLDGFHRDTLMINATENVKRILASLDYPFLDQKALISVLLTIRRRLDLSGTAAVKPTSSTPAERPEGMGSGKVVRSISWGSQPNRSVDTPVASTQPPPIQSSPSVTPKEAPKVGLVSPTKIAQSTPPAADDDAPVRRYRGVAY